MGQTSCSKIFLDRGTILLVRHPKKFSSLLMNLTSLLGVETSSFYPYSGVFGIGMMRVRFSNSALRTQNLFISSSLPFQYFQGIRTTVFSKHFPRKLLDKDFF